MTGLRVPRAPDQGFLVLTQSEVESIHSNALDLLFRTGVVVHSDPALALLGRAGALVSPEDQRVRIPVQMVQEALDLAPSTVTLYSRLGEPAMLLGAGGFHARTSSGATRVLDLQTRRLRTATSQDAADAARVADALPRVHGVSSMAVQPGDVPAELVDVYAVRTALAHTTKPLGYVCLNESLIESVITMAKAVAGGPEALRTRPILTALAESTSPLSLVSSQMAVLQAFALQGLPLTLHAHPIAGFSAPVTLAGTLVVMHAEILAMVTITQLIRPRTPVIYGMSSSVADMRGARNLSGAAEIGLLGSAVAHLARRCGLPALMSSGTDAHAPGAQSVMERLMTLLPPALAGIDLVNLTTLGTKMSFSLEQLVIDDVALCLVGRLLRGIQVDEERLAMDLIHQVGPAGSYIEAAHTRRYHREELLTPSLLVRDTVESWEASGAPTLGSRARREAERILAEHRPVPLTAEVEAQLDQVVQAAGREGRKRVGLR
jgi:trimethylamine--corrinoid protein Co-methyltransferase